MTPFWLYLKKFSLFLFFNLTRILFHSKGITKNHSVLRGHFPPLIFWEKLATPVTSQKKIGPHGVKKFIPPLLVVLSIQTGSSLVPPLLATRLETPESTKTTE